jgi:hypothetical protein
MPLRLHLGLQRVLLACLPLLLLATPGLAYAGCANAPLHWAKTSVNENDQAVEHLTIRAHAGGGLDTFIRFSLANAGFKHGELTVTLKQEAVGGTYYAKETFKRGEYTIFSDRFGLRAGKHLIEVKNGVLEGTMAFANGVQASFSMTASIGTMTAADRSGSGYIFREALIPMGRLTLNASDAGGRTLVGHTATGFAMHDASTATAHRVYDRAIQLHHMNAGSYLVVDYIVLAEERGHRPLGFLIASGKGRTFAGEIAKEMRDNEKVDEKVDYRVPWQVSVLAKRGDTRAAVRLVADKQVEREDDLADLNYLARKAVGTLMHPISYTLKGVATAELQSGTTDPPVTWDANIRYKYAQVRE